MTVSVLFVCLGNICRSPTAHGVFEALVKARNLQSQIAVDSAGTGDWHIGRPPDSRMQAVAGQRGYDLSALVARQVEAADFHRFNYMLAMDRANYRDLMAIRPADATAELRLFLDFARHTGLAEVPDPYYGGEDDFHRVVDLVEEAAEGLLEAILHDAGEPGAGDSQ